MTSILQSEQYIEKCIDVWIEELDAMVDKKESFDLWVWTRMYVLYYILCTTQPAAIYIQMLMKYSCRYAYDVVGELYFSKMFGFLQSGGDHLGYIAATDDLIPIQFLAGNMPTYVRSIFMLTGVLFPKVRGALKALGSLTEATNTMLKNRLAALQSGSDDSKPQRADILGKLMDISHKNGKELDFVLDDVKMEVFIALYVLLNPLHPYLES